VGAAHTRKLFEKSLTKNCNKIAKTARFLENISKHARHRTPRRCEERSDEAIQQEANGKGKGTQNE